MAKEYLFWFYLDDGTLKSFATFEALERTAKRRVRAGGDPITLLYNLEHLGVVSLNADGKAVTDLYPAGCVFA